MLSKQTLEVIRIRQIEGWTTNVLPFHFPLKIFLDYKETAPV